MDFFLWGYVKDNVYIPPLPTTLQDLRARIREAFGKIDEEMKHRVWQECNTCAEGPQQMELPEVYLSFALVHPPLPHESQIHQT
ncbi:hypothetical protein J437_LFUL016639 [Ladona fulva]|uniref:Uncharacterized protein n=1 Tax=Ladona fulva TaxID=123851 RepID=A0A8K0KQT0_LADFU|nr:hypothetical protein J437_LFUL016639 [Ladona fulva]